jgi:hypothetical protein
MFSDGSVTMKMGEMGRSKARKHFTPERHYEGFMSILEKINGRKPG